MRGDRVCRMYVLNSAVVTDGRRKGERYDTL